MNEMTLHTDLDGVHRFSPSLEEPVCLHCIGS
jgi:hypothetical protein